MGSALLARFNAVRSNPPVADVMPPEYGQAVAPDGFDYQNALLLVADTREKLRRCDLDRLFDSLPSDRWPGMANYILRARPELAEPIAATIQELTEDRKPPIERDHHARPIESAHVASTDKPPVFRIESPIGGTLGTFTADQDSPPAEPARQYRYGLTLRPAGFPPAWGHWELLERGTVGSYPLRTDLPEGRFPHGVVAFPHPIADSNISHFDLTPLDTPESDQEPAAAEEPADGESGATGETGPAGVTVAVDMERRRIDLAFPDKPSAEVREQLKAAGWRWHGQRGVWFHKDTPENRAFVASIGE